MGELSRETYRIAVEQTKKNPADLACVNPVCDEALPAWPDALVEKLGGLPLCPRTW